MLGDPVQVLVAVDAEIGALGCLCVCQEAGRGLIDCSVAGPGSDFSEELVDGVVPAALDCRVAPECPLDCRGDLGQWALLR